MLLTQQCPIYYSNNRNYPLSLSVCVCVCVCFSVGVRSRPGCFIFLLSLVVWQCFSGPLIQYDHFTVPGGKSRYSAQHTQYTQLLLVCRGHTGCAGPRWWVRDAGTRHGFRPWTNRRRPGPDKLKVCPAKPRQSGCEPASQQLCV